jgi:hypothetical protein
MGIIRKTSILIKTERKFVVRQLQSDAQIYCEKCAEQMIPAQASADLFGISSREIYRLIETEQIHFIETEANEIYVCPGLVTPVPKTI